MVKPVSRWRIRAPQTRRHDLINHNFMDQSIRMRWREQGLARGISRFRFLISSMSIIIVSIRVMGIVIVMVSSFFYDCQPSFKFD